jgi:hypothetical protein
LKGKRYSQSTLTNLRLGRRPSSSDLNARELSWRWVDERGLEVGNDSLLGRYFLAFSFYLPHFPQLTLCCWIHTSCESLTERLRCMYGPTPPTIVHFAFDDVSPSPRALLHDFPIGLWIAIARLGFADLVCSCDEPVEDQDQYCISTVTHTSCVNATLAMPCSPFNVVLLISSTVPPMSRFATASAQIWGRVTNTKSCVVSITSSSSRAPWKWSSACQS